MQHPNYDQFWKDRNILPKLKNIKCATMTVGGWYDNEDLLRSTETYQHIERQNPGIFNVLVIGPWFHGGWSRRWRLARARRTSVRRRAIIIAKHGAAVLQSLPERQRRHFADQRSQSLRYRLRMVEIV